MSTASRTYSSADNRGSREIERDIEQTRSEMDRTLDEIGDRLHPRHLLDDVMDLFRSEDVGRSAWVSEARRSSRRTLRKIRRNPIPALLVGAGIAYLLMDDEEEPQDRMRSRERWREADDIRASQWQSDRDVDPWGGAAAWQDDYEWNDAAFDQQGWTARAEATLKELQESISRADQPAHQRVRSAAAKVLELSGRNRSEIRRALREQWDETPEHSGSFVDARTGQPYDESYGMESQQQKRGEDWRQLAGCDVLSISESADDDQSDWREQAESTMQSIQSTLGDAASTAKQKLNAVAQQLGLLGTKSRHFAGRYGHKTGEGVRHFGQGAQRLGQDAQRRVSAAGRQIGEGASAARRQVSDGYRASRDTIAETMEDHPLAAGAAVLGLGLIIGSLLPRTRCEDETFGAQSDQAKRDAKQLGREAVERGQEVASSAGEAAKEELQRQGLTPGQIAEKARETVAAVGETLAHETPSTGEVRERVQRVAATAGQRAAEEARQQGAGLKDSARRNQT